MDRLNLHLLEYSVIHEKVYKFSSVGSSELIKYFPFIAVMPQVIQMDCLVFFRQLSFSKEGFTEASLGLLANQRRRTLLTGLLKSLRTIKTLVGSLTWLHSAQHVELGTSANWKNKYNLRKRIDRCIP